MRERERNLRLGVERESGGLWLRCLRGLGGDREIDIWGLEREKERYWRLVVYRGRYWGIGV